MSGRRTFSPHAGVEREEQEARALQQASLSGQEELRAAEGKAASFKEQVAAAEQECVSQEDGECYEPGG